MDVKDFFNKANAICYEHCDKECTSCPLDEFCSDGIFAMNRGKAERLIDTVKSESEM